MYLHIYQIFGHGHPTPLFYYCPSSHCPPLLPKQLLQLACHICIHILNSAFEQKVSNICFSNNGLFNLSLPSNPIRFPVNDIISFFVLNKMPHGICHTHSLSIDLGMDMQTDSITLLWKMSEYTTEITCLCLSYHLLPRFCS